MPGYAAKNVSCVHGRVVAGVIARNQTCFRSCPEGKAALPKDPSDCWTQCLFATILGTWNGFSGQPGIQGSELVSAFEQAMSSEARGGCPHITLEGWGPPVYRG